MNRIVLVGDTHGFLDTQKIVDYQQSSKKLDENDYLIICGDCGVVWDKKSLNKSIELYSSFKTNILFVDGNHENYDLLKTFPITEWNGGKVQKITENIIHLMRGQIFNICDKTFLTIGGANSTDISYRKPHKSWWIEEEFTTKDLNLTLFNLEKYNYKVDFVISHSPTSECIDELINIFTKCGESVPLFLQEKLEYSYTSKKLQTICDKLDFKKWFCGHLHINEETKKYCVLYDRFYELK